MPFSKIDFASWVILLDGSPKLSVVIYLLVEQDVLRVLEALCHLAGITVYPKPLETAF